MKIWLSMRWDAPEHLYTDDPFWVEVEWSEEYGPIEPHVLTEDGEPAEWAREWLDWSRFNWKFREAQAEYIRSEYGSERAFRWADGQARAWK